MMTLVTSLRVPSAQFPSVHSCLLRAHQKIDLERADFGDLLKVTVKRRDWHVMMQSDLSNQEINRRR